MTKGPATFLIVPVLMETDHSPFLCFSSEQDIASDSLLDRVLNALDPGARVAVDARNPNYGRDKLIPVAFQLLRQLLRQRFRQINDAIIALGEPAKRRLCLVPPGNRKGIEA